MGGGCDKVGSVRKTEDWMEGWRSGRLEEWKIGRVEDSSEPRLIALALPLS